MDPVASSAAALSTSLMGASSHDRAVAGGLLGPVAAVPYLLGCCHMLLACNTATGHGDAPGRWARAWGALAFLGHAAAFVCVACYHSQFAYTAFVAQTVQSAPVARGGLLQLLRSHQAYMR